jgi:hypothetical protein
MHVRPAHINLPKADLLTKSPANQAVYCLAQGYALLEALAGTVLLTVSSMSTRSLPAW